MPFLARALATLPGNNSTVGSVVSRPFTCMKVAKRVSAQPQLCTHNESAAMTGRVLLAVPVPTSTVVNRRSPTV
eukprot:4769438-Amphidinium_carterae.1